MSVTVRLMDGPAAGRLHAFAAHPGRAIEFPHMPAPGVVSKVRYDLQPPMTWEAETYGADLLGYSRPEGGRLCELTQHASPELFVVAFDARYVVDQMEKMIRGALLQHGCNGPSHMRWWAEVVTIHSNWVPTRIPWDRSRPRELPDGVRMIGCTGTARQTPAPAYPGPATGTP